MKSSDISFDIIILDSDNKSFYRSCQYDGKKGKKSYANVIFVFLYCRVIEEEKVETVFCCLCKND